MKNLIQTPYSEVTATLEALARNGVKQRHWARIRTDSDFAKNVSRFLQAGGWEKGIKSWFSDWRSFYRNMFGFEFSTMDVTKIEPLMKDGFDRLIVVWPRIFNALEHAIHNIIRTDHFCLHNLSHINRPQSLWPYVILVRDSFEPDPGLIGFSPNAIQKKIRTGINMYEYFLLILKIHQETGIVIDSRTATLCVGSINNKGEVPCFSSTNTDTLTCGLIGGDEITHANLRGSREVRVVPS